MKDVMDQLNFNERINERCNSRVLVPFRLPYKQNAQVSIGNEANTHVTPVTVQSGW